MHTLKLFRRKMWTLGALLALSGGAAHAQQFLDDQPKTSPPMPVAPVPLQPSANGEPRFAFEMRDKPWIQVLEWLGDKTKLPVYADDKPTGTFTYIGVKGSSTATYSIPEIIDILNEALDPKFILVRQYSSIKLFAVDTVNPQSNFNVPRRTVDELAKCGNTELVQVQYTVEKLNAEQLVPQIRQMLSKFGSVTANPQTNQLLIQDKAGNLIRFFKDFQAIEKGEKGPGEHLDHVCVYITALEAERQLKDTLGISDPLAPTNAAGPPNAGFQPGGGAGRRGGGNNFDPNNPGFGRGGFDPNNPGGGRFRGFDPNNPPAGFDPAAAAAAMAAMAPGGAPAMIDMGNMGAFAGGARGGRGAAANIKPLIVSCDESTNTVFVNGPADRVSVAKDTLKKIDVGDKPVKVGKPTLQNHAVTAGTSDSVAKMLSDRYRDSKVITITSIGNNSIMVWAPPEDQFKIATIVKGSSEVTNQNIYAKVEVILDAADVKSKLIGMFGDRSTTTSATQAQGFPYIEIDNSSNAIIVKGTTQQVADVKAAIDAIQGTSSGASGSGVNSPTMRVITLESGSAASLAEGIGKFIQKNRSNPVRIYNGMGDDDTKKEKKPPAKPMDKPDARRGDVPTWRAMGTPGNDAPLQLVADPPVQQPPAITDPQADKPKTPPTKGEGAPVNITVFGNRLIITSEDPVALAYASQLMQMFAKGKRDPGDFKVFKLKSAVAADAARVLDEAFNGPKQPAQGGNAGGFGGRGGNPFGGMPFAQNVPAPAAPSEGRIRIVADNSSNSLLVSANPLDMITIERLLEKAIDDTDKDPRGLIQTHFVKLLNSNADEVADVIRQVYAEQMNQNSTNTRNPLAAFASAVGGNKNVDSFGNPRAVTLSVGVDYRNNSLVIASPESLFKDISVLIEEVEKASKDTTITVKIVAAKGVDSDVVQQAVDAMSGRSTASRQGNGFGGGGFGGNGNGFGGGGFGGRPGGGGGFGGPGGGGGFGGPGGGGGFGGPGGGGGFGGAMGGRGGMGGPGGGGMGGGGAMGGGRGGGGGAMGGGGAAGGGGRRGGAPRQAPQAATEGDPRFFVDRVMDDPGLTALYDPQEDFSPMFDGADVDEPRLPMSPLQQPMVDPMGPLAPPDESPNFKAPRGPVIIESLSTLGGIIIRANNPDDAKAALAIIEYLQRLQKEAQVEFELVPLQYGDATYITSQLNQMFARVQLTGTGPSTAITRTQQGGGFGGGGFGGGGANQVQNQSTVLALPQVRSNAILIAMPLSQRKYVIEQIKKLDQPATGSKLVPIQLKRAPAAQVATWIQTFYSERYGNETNQVRVAFDNSTNSIMIQASPADMVEIRQMVEWVEGLTNSATYEFKIIKLKNSLSDELSQTLLQAITQGMVPPTNNGGGVVPVSATGTPGANTALNAATANRPAAAGGTTGTGVSVNANGFTGITTKQTALRFVSADQKKVIEAMQFEDVHITSEPRSNTLMIAAPQKTMELLETLIKELDVVAAARASIKVFTLQKADANLVSNLLSQLFKGTTATGGGGGGGGVLPVGGNGGSTTGTATNVSRPVLVGLSGTPSDGASLIDLRVTVDDRTNSLIVAGSQNDLEVIEALVSRLEDQNVATRQTMVFKLRNQAAADVAQALTTFFTNTLGIYSTAGLLSPYNELARSVVVTPEPVSNTILVSATPNYFGHIQKIIDEVDALPPQVMIQCLVAEVDLTNDKEFGVELSGQSPVLFNRSVGTTGAVTNTAIPGFNFNQTGATTVSGLPAGTLASSALASPGTVGFQGLNNFGTGVSSPTQNVGGFVFQASSNSVNVLLRALSAQSRIDILSRPEVMATDNQAARINIGQTYPIVTGTTVTATGLVTQTIDRATIGIILTVTPRITPEGRVIMRVLPEVSSVGATVNLGNGNISTALNVQQVETTVAAMDGETVAIGGMLNTKDTRTQVGIPVLSDIPVIGALFRYRSRQTARTELVVILTPHVIRNQTDSARIVAEETAKLKWNLSQVDQIHGHGTELMLPAPKTLVDVPANSTPFLGQTVVPGNSPPSPLAAPRQVQPAVPQNVTPPNPLPPPSQVVPMAIVPPDAAPQTQLAPINPNQVNQTSAMTPVQNSNPGKALPWSAPRQQ